MRGVLVLTVPDCSLPSVSVCCGSPQPAEWVLESHGGRRRRTAGNELVKGTAISPDVVPVANVFSYGGWTGVMMFAEAIRRGAATRPAINRELERMVFVGPEGIHRFGKLKHAGLSSRSLVTSTIRKCKLVPIPGQDLGG